MARPIIKNKNPHPNTTITFKSRLPQPVSPSEFRREASQGLGFQPLNQSSLSAHNAELPLPEGHVSLAAGKRG